MIGMMDTAQPKPGTPSPGTSAPGTSTRRKGPVALETLLGEQLSPVIRAQGFANMAVHLHWAEIAGTSLSQWSEAVALKWPPRPTAQASTQAPNAPGGATLVIKVEGAFALELQHSAPQVIERVNRFFGWRCVEKIVIKQGPVRKQSAPPKRPRKPLSVENSLKLNALLADMENETLRASLERLGVAMLTRSHNP
jgi:hypothetical protein